ncbi:hypothetical protein [Kangiella sediminilitoris]|uniref:Uncharacterized protein n=1 Tax=Kangiella sediminilitoris TaxID=1144748 RepID=A0A1B3BBL7_9GAMM|nr:hypothetical protein [Kangiella sediminilitoris]AOE50183.1 hypothetical protein KS2013_1471 [Kangiella sediminilitoris]
MASLFLAYGLVLAVFAVALFSLILKAYRNQSSEFYSPESVESLFAENGNVVDLSAYKRADISALKLIQEYSLIEASSLQEKDKLHDILAWNQKLESFELNNRTIIQSRGFLRPVQSNTQCPSKFTVTQL